MLHLFKLPRYAPAILIGAGLCCPGLIPKARANVYVTNLRLNGGTNNAAVAAGGGVTINYTLNEAATAGVIVVFRAGANTIRTLNVAGGGAGALRGTNSVFWDGKDNASNRVSAGTYSVSVTAAATGHAGWQQISSDADAGSYVYAPRGIAVNRNTNSIYFGRVFVANSFPGPNAGFVNGDTVGILKMNADGSLAAEGQHSTGGWAWAGDDFSPWKIEVSDDDFVHVNDFTSQGVVLRFDQQIGSGSQTQVLRSDNWPSGTAKLSGPFIAGAGTNAQVWMADINTTGSVGVRRWMASTNGMLATNDLGATIVQAGGGSDMSIAPYDVALDRSNAIYTVQYRDAAGDPEPRVFRFPAYDELGTPQTNAAWKIGSGDDNLRGASGVAVNPDSTRVAVALAGAGFGFGRVGGGVKVFNATNGAVITTISPAPYHDHTDVAWDNAGNLYLCDYWDGRWRVYSPPGTNAATTFALPTIQVAAPTAPVLSAPHYTSGQFQFTLTGQTNVSYIIEASTNLQHWNSVATNSQTPAIRVIALPAPGTQNYYRAFAL